MYFTYVVRPGDTPVGRSPQFRPLWDGCMNWNLRIGLLCQLVAFAALSAISLVGVDRGLGFVGLLRRENRLISSWNALGATAASLLWVFGATLLNFFRNCGDDDGSIKYARGYRAGTKLINQASLLDIIQASMMALFFYGQFAYLTDDWQTESVQPNPMRVYGLTARLLHAVSLVLYSGAFFLLEAYHTVGVAECWAWSLGFLFKLAGIAEFLAIVTDSWIFTGLFVILYPAALIAAFVWAQSFEPLVLEAEVQMDQSALRNEWFKSRNAMAYYGPQLDGGVEMTTGHNAP